MSNGGSARSAGGQTLDYILIAFVHLPSTRLHDYGMEDLRFKGF